uniref:MITD1 C-terminal phospholipase D-like domain-containing protein n=1 Tax=Romanomermis culicivorax TaxID=13658 RepID=A0A915L4N6_ROMCU
MSSATYKETKDEFFCNLIKSSVHSGIYIGQSFSKVDERELFMILAPRCYDEISFKNRRQICIKDNECGFSYAKIFQNVADKSVTEIRVFDPYIRLNHQ